MLQNLLSNPGSDDPTPGDQYCNTFTVSLSTGNLLTRYTHMATPLTTLDHLAIQARSDRGAADRLYAEVRSILQQEIIAVGRIDPIEAESEANLSFVKAVAGFEEGRAPFEQFLRLRVRFDLKDFQRNQPGGSRGQARVGSLENRWDARSDNDHGGLARDLIPDDAPSASEEAEANELREWVQSLIAELPHDHWKTAATLLWVDGLTVKDAAESMGCGVERFRGIRKVVLQHLKGLATMGSPILALGAYL